MTPGFTPGTKVEVRTTYGRSWARGFEVVAEEPDDGYRVRRISDGAVLPACFAGDDVRRERERLNSMWWV